MTENDRFWNELIFNVCEGDAGNIREVRKMDVYDFFSYLENYDNGRRRTDNIATKRGVR